MISFHASHVAATRKDWGYFVVFSADADFAAELYLRLQAMDRYDDEQVRFGMDDIHVETCGQGWSWYGNMESFELTRNRVSVQLSREAAAHMDNDGRVEATFSLDDTAYAHLRDSLRRIFHGRDYYREGTV